MLRTKANLKKKYLLQFDSIHFKIFSSISSICPCPFFVTFILLNIIFSMFLLTPIMFPALAKLYSSRRCDSPFNLICSLQNLLFSPGSKYDGGDSHRMVLIWIGKSGKTMQPLFKFLYTSFTLLLLVFALH